MVNVVLMFYWRFDLQSGLNLDTPGMDITCPTPCRKGQVEQAVEVLQSLSQMCILFNFGTLRFTTI